MTFFTSPETLVSVVGIFVRHFKFSSKTTADLAAWLHAFCAHESAPAGCGEERIWPSFFTGNS